MPFETKPMPVSTRPKRLASAEAEEMVVVNKSRRYTYRQIGWHGQSGLFYSLDEDPSKYEYGSFSPMWICVHSDIVEKLEV